VCVCVCVYCSVPKPGITQDHPTTLTIQQALEAVHCTLQAAGARTRTPYEVQARNQALSSGHEQRRQLLASDGEWWMG